MRVTFWRFDDGRFSRWVADRGKRRIVPGTVWRESQTLSHDLAGMVVEATLHLDWGFWACVAAGATFESTGRRRTEPGRAVIRAHRRELDAAEHATHEHVTRWQLGAPTPAAAALDDMAGRWAALGEGEVLTVEWPTLRVVTAEAAAFRLPAPSGRRARRKGKARGWPAPATGVDRPR